MDIGCWASDLISLCISDRSNKNINLKEFLWKLHKIIHITEYVAYIENLLVVLILLYVSVSMKCCHEKPTVWVLKHHTSISQSSGGWKVQGQDPCQAGALILLCGWLSSCWVLTHRERTLLSPPSQKDTNAINVGCTFMITFKPEKMWKMKVLVTKSCPALLWLHRL